jgi:hypothetical protein
MMAMAASYRKSAAAGTSEPGEASEHRNRERGDDPVDLDHSNDSPTPP